METEFRRIGTGVNSARRQYYKPQMEIVELQHQSLLQSTSPNNNYPGASGTVSGDNIFFDYPGASGIVSGDNIFFDE